MASTIGVGIHGAGWVAGEHIKSYLKRPDCKIVGISSSSPQKAREKAESLGLKDIKVYSDYSDMVADADIHAISICTPPHLHAEETIQAAEAGKHILIEKAAANDPVSLGKMHRAVQKTGVKTVVSFVLHWNPQFQLIKKLLAEQAIGDIFYGEVDYWHHIGAQYGQYIWNVKKHIAGSVLLSAGIHAVDALRHFVGKDAEEVMAYSNKVNQVYEYDTNLVGIIKFAGGSIGKVSASFDVQCPYAFNIDLLGEKGTIRDNRIYAADFFTGQTDWVTVPTIRPDSGDVAHHPFDGQIAHFLDCIQNDVESFVNLADAVKSHTICYAMDRSAELGRPVRIDEINAEM